MVGNYIPENRRLGFIERTKHFAWFPVKLKNGKYVWLSTVVKVREVVQDESSASSLFSFIGLGKLNKDIFYYEKGE